MIDSFEMMRDAIEADATRARLGLSPKGYGVVTLHRPSNVDRKEQLAPLIGQLVNVARDLPLVFAVHPRTRRKLEEFGLAAELASATGLILIEPLGYVEFMNLVLGSRVVITDSGGIQEESTYLGIPCMTLRENTERPITITEGTNRLVQPAEIATQMRAALDGSWPSGRRPELWDGRTAERCVAALARRNASRR